MMPKFILILKVLDMDTRFDTQAKSNSEMAQLNKLV